MENMLSTLEDEISLRTGHAVKRQREAAGFSLRTLAARSGISSSMISDIERGAAAHTLEQHPWIASNSKQTCGAKATAS